MSDIPKELFYTKTHEWVKQNDDGTVSVGITDYAQGLLGDIVFVEVPEVGTQFITGDDCAVVESVKAASDIYCPVSGEVTAVNETLEDSPETINKDAYQDGWIFTLTPEDKGEVEALLDSAAYKELAESEEH
ncbi:Glycine cleavage system H protein [hydrothermal vent metagenome]|uniref:Glycine cleavage system H protein n=1 Tax=hydrothermal vent metagenome TaxID=652676 RepID=A0A3B1AEE3_9ZZZZ